MAVGLLGLFALPPQVSAQVTEPDPPAEVRLKLPDSTVFTATPTRSFTDAKRWRSDLDAKNAATAQAPSSARRERSVGRKILGASIGAVSGFFAGGYLGAKIEGPCDCDDPGFKGAVIGAPIGALVGGIVGAKFF